jgi:pre-mRNA cleavage complex 2 protein Pcf11
MAYQSYPNYPPAPSYAAPPTASSHAYYPPPQQQHYQPPPAPISHDPFRAYYADRLRELTFNSRPLIQELSLLAMQMRDSNQWSNMTAVVEEIEGAVYRVRPPV